jgi:hypothetical protein
MLHMWKRQLLEENLSKSKEYMIFIHEKDKL